MFYLTLKDVNFEDTNLHFRELDRKELDTRSQA